MYVVGESTGQTVRDLLELDSLGGHSGSAQALAQFIVDREQNSRGNFLFPKGNLARSALVEDLSSSGHSVDEVTVYTTVPNRELPAAIGALEEFPDFIVIFSPSGAVASLPLLQQKHPESLKQAKIIAIGPTTSGEIEKLGVPVYKVVRVPSAEALGELLTEDIKL